MNIRGNTFRLCVCVPWANPESVHSAYDFRGAHTYAYTYGCRILDLSHSKAHNNV